jgi:GNAT superfamily N-acetyltransferase
MELGDAALPPSAPPLAALALVLDRATFNAHLVAAGVVSTLRRRGLGRRLFEGAAMLLRSEGIQTVHTVSEVDTAGWMWLAALGFAADDGTPANRLVYWL